MENPTELINNSFVDDNFPPMSYNWSSASDEFQLKKITQT